MKMIPKVKNKLKVGKAFTRRSHAHLSDLRVVSHLALNFHNIWLASMRIIIEISTIIQARTLRTYLFTSSYNIIILLIIYMISDS